MAELASPNTGNYSVLKGNVYWTPAGGTKRHLGNCTQFDFEPVVDTLEHYSQMEGVKVRDLSVAIQKSATVSLTLDEISLKNLQLALLGGSLGADPITATTDGHGEQGFNILTQDLVNGILELEGSNDIGPKYRVYLPSVNFKPNGAISFMGDADWASIELQGDVLAINGSFGRVNLLT